MTNGLLGRTTTTGSGPGGSEPSDVAALLDATAEVRDMRRELGTSACTGAGVEAVHKGRQGSRWMVSGCVMLALHATNSPRPFSDSNAICDQASEILQMRGLKARHLSGGVANPRG